MAEYTGDGHGEKFRDIVDGLVAAEGILENLTRSGGEPSMHPDFREFVAMAARPEVSRVSLVTNGLRIARDPEFRRMLKARNVYVILQWDGFHDDVHQRLRGRRLMDVKARALANIETFDPDPNPKAFCGRRISSRFPVRTRSVYRSPTSSAWMTSPMGSIT